MNFGTAYAVAAGGGTSTFTTLSPVVYAAPTFRLTARTLTSATYAFDRPTTGLNPYLQVEVGGSWRTLTGSTFTIGAGDEAWNPALAAADAGTAFSFRARWVNSTGPTNGAAATIADSTRARIPEAPQGLAGRYSEPDITFTWTAPSDAADPPTSYEYALRTAQVADLATLTRDGTITAPSTSYAALGVTAFSRYWLYIRAVNVNGTSAWASVSVTTTPEQAANTTSVTVNWTEVEGYDYEIQTSDSEWRTASSPFVLYGLPPGQLVDIDVRALWRGRPGLPATISQLTLPARPAMLANRAYASTTTTATFQFDPAAVGTTEHPITVLCTITGTDDQGGVITQTPTVALDSDRRWTWTATGDFVNQRGLTATFTYRNATGTGPAFAVNFSLTPGAVGVGVLEVTSTSIRVGVPRTEYAGTAVILQFQRGTEGWVNAQDFDPSVGDADNIGVRWGSLTPNTQYAIQARLVQPTTPPTNGPATTLQVYTAPATPTGITVSRRGFATLPTIADITYYHQGTVARWIMVALAACADAERIGAPADLELLPLLRQPHLLRLGQGLLRADRRDPHDLALRPGRPLCAPQRPHAPSTRLPAFRRGGKACGRSGREGVVPPPMPRATLPPCPRIASPNSAASKHPNSPSTRSTGAFTAMRRRRPSPTCSTRWAGPMP